MKAAVLVAALVLTAAAPARALDVDLQAYDEARRRGEMVTIAGRVYTERRRPNAEDLPMARAVVVALPRSEALVRRHADGRFTLSDLPAGRWMVWATHSEFLDARSPRYQARDRERYRLPPRLVGYYAERAWLREVDTTPGASRTLELNDRNVWFAGVVEDRVLDAGPSR